MKLINHFLITLLSLNAIAADAQVLQRVEKLHQRKTGEIREFVQGTMTTSCSRWVIIETDQNGKVVSQCGDLRMYTMADTSDPVKIVSTSGETVVEFKPFMPNLSFPLFIGKRWSGRYTGFIAKDNRRWEGEKQCEVKAVERIRATGTLLDTFRIECEDHWKVNYFLSGTTHATTWFAPGIGAVKGVHSDSIWNYELANYRNH